MMTDLLSTTIADGNLCIVLLYDNFGQNKSCNSHVELLHRSLLHVREVSATFATLLDMLYMHFNKLGALTVLGMLLPLDFSLSARGTFEKNLNILVTDLKLKVFRLHKWRF